MTPEGESTGSPPAPLTFSEALHHYFETGNELYEARARGDKDKEMIDALQKLVDALVADLSAAADAAGRGDEFRSAIDIERTLERRALWFRTTARKLNAEKPIHSMQMLGSAGVVAVVYYVLRRDAVLALLALGLLLIGIRLTLPSIANKVATYHERQLRALRRVGDSPSK